MGKINQIMAGQSVYLDANVFIYALEAYPEFVQAITVLFNRIDQGELDAVTSQLTLAETLVKPFRDKNISLQQAYQNAIQNTDFLKVVEISTDILVEAARLRAFYFQIRLPDAIHLATAYTHHCDMFITNDKRLKDIGNHIDVFLLSEES